MKGLLIIAVGLFPIIASVFNWDWFFNHRKAKIFVKLFTRNGARIFYSFLGIVLIALGVYCQFFYY